MSSLTPSGARVVDRAFIEEARAFPYGRYDDQIDSASSAFNYLARSVNQGGAFGIEGFTGRRRTDDLGPYRPPGG